MVQIWIGIWSEGMGLVSVVEVRIRVLVGALQVEINHETEVRGQDADQKCQSLLRRAGRNVRKLRRGWEFVSSLLEQSTEVRNVWTSRGCAR